jgi:hypothetical protein
VIAHSLTGLAISILVVWAAILGLIVYVDKRSQR